MKLEFQAMTELARRLVAPAENVNTNIARAAARHDRAGSFAHTEKKGRRAMTRFITLACLILAAISAAPATQAQSSPTAMPFG